MNRLMCTAVGIAISLGIGVHAEKLDDAHHNESPFAMTIYFENDGTFVKRNHPTDRHYTNGVKITFSHQPRWAQDLAKLLPLAPTTNENNQPLRTAAGYAFGQNIYTPDNIDVPTLIPNDRPYAGWLYGGVYLQRATAREFDHFEINLGLIGPSSQAEQVQKEIHDIFNAIEPRGWDHQLGDEVAFNFIYRRKWKISLLTSEGTDVVQLIPQTGLTLGTVSRHIDAGALVRIGVNLPDDFGPGRIGEPAAATGISHGQSGGYIFVRIGGKAVEHDVFLEGSNYRSSHSVDPEHFVGETQVGLVIYWNRFELGYSQTFLTRQFEMQRDKDSFGALTLTWTGHF